MEQNPILVERYRGPVLESFHRGVVCIMDQDGKILYSKGNVDQLCYPRSALKLIQILPLLESGAVEAFGFTTEELAIMCGSHNGEAEHLRVVNSILAKIGLPDSTLGCGAQYPTLPEDRNQLIKTDKQPEALHNNCSGKHAGFLAYCVYKGYDTENYLDPSHPLQLDIRRVVAEMHEVDEQSLQMGMDGCSAPIFALTVRQQTIGYKNLMNPSAFSEARQKSCARVIEAVTSYPFMIAGHKRYCTEMMEVAKGRIFGKTGADGIYSLGFTRDKIACTIKIDDGLMGPQYAVAQQIIEKSGVLTQDEMQGLHVYLESPIKNWNKFETGKEVICRTTFEDLVWPARKETAAVV